VKSVSVTTVSWRLWLQSVSKNIRLYQVSITL
jgi:hypothetical protein